MDVEDECGRLLDIIIGNPRLVGLLSSHLNPAVTSPNNYIKLYQTVSQIPPQQSELTFVLLSKVGAIMTSLQGFSELNNYYFRSINDFRPFSLEQGFLRIYSSEIFFLY